MSTSVFISGDFQKYYDGLERKRKEFEDAGFVVLSRKSPIVVTAMETSLLRGRYDPVLVKTIGKREIEEMQFAIRKSDALFIYNPNGNVDPVAALQIGIALGYKKPIFSEKEMEDGTLREYCQVATVDKIKGELLRNGGNDAIWHSTAQGYIKDI